MEFRFDLPMSMLAVNKKHRAWLELFGTRPEMVVTGYLTTAANELVFAAGHELPVTDLGRFFVYARVDGRRTAIRPQSTSADHRPALIFRQRR